MHRDGQFRAVFREGGAYLDADENDDGYLRMR
jgi:hypothetical protein